MAECHSFAIYTSGDKVTEYNVCLTAQLLTTQIVKKVTKSHKHRMLVSQQKITR